MSWPSTLSVQKPLLKKGGMPPSMGKGGTGKGSFTNSIMNGAGGGGGGSPSSMMQNALSKMASMFGKGFGKGGGDFMEMFKMMKGAGKGWGAPRWNNDNRGKGGGKGRGGGGSNGKPLAPGIEIDRETRFTGKVSMFHKWRGFGFVDLNQKGILPEDRAFVHWHAITSDDRHPFLTEGMDVELSFVTYQDRSTGRTYARARNVTLPGGASVAIQDDLDAQTKTFIGGQHLRYLGKLHWFDARRGVGQVTMEDGYSLPEPVPKELRVDASEINAGGRKPTSVKDIDVEFGLWKNEKGTIKCYNMTLPDGLPMTREALEKREVLQGRFFNGVVVMNRWQQGYGFIKPDEKQALPPKVVAKFAHLKRTKNLQSDNIYFRNGDVQPGQKLRRDGKVKFMLYTDEQGVGAYDIISTEPVA